MSSLLKAFLRRLPDPILTDTLYPDFIEASRADNLSNRLKILRHLVRFLKIFFLVLLYGIYLVGMDRESQPPTPERSNWHHQLKIYDLSIPPGGRLPHIFDPDFGLLLNGVYIIIIFLMILMI